MSSIKRDFHVKDLIIDDEYGTIPSSATVRDAAKKMKNLGVPDLVVIEEGKDKVLGVIADFDIVQNVVAEGNDCSEEKVIDTMYVIEPVKLNDLVETAFARMQDLQVNVIPVVENGKLVGVCSIQDCWSYIPNETFDEIGLIPVSNTKIVEFWFASVCSILGFILGVILPLAGIYGFFSGQQGDLLSFFGVAELRGGTISFYFFEARGEDFFVSYLNLVARNGAIWVFIVIFSFFILTFGIMGIFSIIYTGFSDTRHIITGSLIRFLFPGLFVITIIVQWIFFGAAFATVVPPANVVVDGLGLTMSVVSMVLFVLAMIRNYIFRGKLTEQRQSGVQS